jgi:uncharacterized protein
MKKIILLFSLFLAPLSAETAKLSVRGEAAIKKPADQASINIGVVTEAPNARDAIDANNKKMGKVIETLKDFGLEKGELLTGQFQVVPQYSQRPKPAPEDWKPKVTGYQVINNIKVKTTLLDQLGEILDEVSGAGANSISDIRFSLKDPREHRKEAITKATQNAIQDAKVLADAADVKLARILSISLDQSEIRPYMRAAAMNEAVPIEPGDVDVSASVNLVYELSLR